MLEKNEERSKERGKIHLAGTVTSKAQLENKSRQSYDALLARLIHHQLTSTNNNNEVSPCHSGFTSSLIYLYHAIFVGRWSLSAYQTHNLLSFSSVIILINIHSWKNASETSNYYLRLNSHAFHPNSRVSGRDPGTAILVDLEQLHWHSMLSCWTSATPPST